MRPADFGPREKFVIRFFLKRGGKRLSRAISLVTRVRRRKGKNVACLSHNGGKKEKTEVTGEKKGIDPADRRVLAQLQEGGERGVGSMSLTCFRMWVKGKGSSGKKTRGKTNGIGMSAVLRTCLEDSTSWHKREGG